ncbi:MAG TPA: signal peptidase I, partial [Kiritimatiellia bacterium]
METGESVRTICGTSMRPLMRAGQRVGIRPVPVDSIRPGDIIAFQSAKRVVLHRVIDVHREGQSLRFREKGDNRPLSTVIRDDQVLGKAVWLDGNSARTDLDHPRRFNLRLVTSLSRAEGAVFDTLRAAWLRIAGTSRTRAAARMTRAVRLALLPAKWLLSPLYFSLYRTEPRGNDAACAHAMLACVRHACGDATSSPPFPGDVDWNDAMRAAVAHGIEGLLAGKLDIPAGDPRRRNMQLLRYRGARQYAATVATLLAAQQALAAKNIPFIALKGPSLATELYDDPTVRPSADIDLLVRKRDVEAALAALAGDTHELHGSDTSRAIARRSHFHIVLDPLRPPYTKIELHWDLVDRANLYRIDSDQLFERSRNVSVEGTPCAVPGLEDTLIYLCLHAAKHGLFNASGLEARRAPAWYCGAGTGNRLIWFVDVQKYLARHAASMDWTSLRAR